MEIDTYLDNSYYCQYKNLCERAKIMLFNFLLRKQEDYGLLIDDYNWVDNSLSPIEQIFIIAFRIYVLESDLNFDLCGIPIKTIFMEEIKPQQYIKYKDKNYKVDFEFNLERNKNYKLKRNHKYVIELDGYDYHSNKTQMQYDYERENNLKELDYNVIRFTGSQIFKKPFECVQKIVNMILNDIKKEILYD